MEFFKKHKIDFIIFSILFSICSVTAFSFYLPKLKENNNKSLALVYLKDEVIFQFDLDKEKEERQYWIHGLNGLMILGLKKDMICVKESSCPHKYCVKQGYIDNKSSLPIVCSYNEISVFVSSSSFEVNV